MPLPDPSIHYSTDFTAKSIGTHEDRKFEQFIVYFRVLPKAALANGKRREYTLALEKLAARLETAMIGLGYTVAESRALDKPQFGQFTSSVVMVGFVTNENTSSIDYRQNSPTLSLRTVDHNEGSRTGIGGNVQHGQIPSANLLTAVQEFKAAVDAMLATDFVANGISASIYRLDYMGVTFGDRGIHFPNP